MSKIVYATSWLRVVSLVVCAATAWSSSAFAVGSSRPNARGGLLAPIEAVIGQYNQTGELFRIEGVCKSSCTMFLAIRNVCVDRNATLLFHSAPTPGATNRMMSAYNASLRDFLVANHYLDTFEFHAISGRDIIQKFGYRSC